MFQNGIAKNSGNGSGGIYSKTLKFSDINYQVAQRNEQIDMFSRYCELMNYFDPKINVQISVHNRRIDMEDFKRNMFLKYADDGMDELRDEFSKMLEDKTLQGQNSIVREKYISFSVEAESYEAAYSALSRIETDVSNQLKGLGCKVMPLSGEERLGFISSILNPSEPLRFDYDYLTGTGLGTKDFVSPYYFDFCPDGKKTYFEFGDYFGHLSTYQLHGQHKGFGACENKDCLHRKGDCRPSAEAPRKEHRPRYDSCGLKAPQGRSGQASFRYAEQQSAAFQRNSPCFHICKNYKGA